ncbi:hypothetical protein [Luteibacter yeojuensis]
MTGWRYARRLVLMLFRKTPLYRLFTNAATKKMGGRSHPFFTQQAPSFAVLVELAIERQAWNKSSQSISKACRVNTLFFSISCATIISL